MSNKVLCKSAILVKDLVSGKEEHSYVHLAECDDSLILLFETKFYCKFSNEAFIFMKNNLGRGDDFCLSHNRRQHLVIDRMMFMQILQNFLSVVSINHLENKFNEK